MAKQSGMVQKLVSQPSFDARGVYVPAGQIGVFDTEKLSGKEKHLKDVGNFQPAIVEIAPIAPTGPNPRTPQQIPPDAIQTAGGGYVLPGKQLVAQGSDRAGEGGDEAKVTETLSDIMDTNEGGRGATTGNADDDLVDGTVAEVTKDLGGKTDAELEALRSAEKDREKPRAGVLSAIDKELKGRQG